MRDFCAEALTGRRTARQILPFPPSLLALRTVIDPNWSFGAACQAMQEPDIWQKLEPTVLLTHQSVDCGPVVPYSLIPFCDQVGLSLDPTVVLETGIGRPGASPTLRLLLSWAVFLTICPTDSGHGGPSNSPVGPTGQSVLKLASRRAVESGN